MYDEGVACIQSHDVRRLCIIHMGNVLSHSEKCFLKARRFEVLFSSESTLPNDYQLKRKTVSHHGFKDHNRL